jgi:hypothetical protein
MELIPLQAPYVDDQVYLRQVVAETTPRELHEQGEQGAATIRPCEDEQGLRQRPPTQQHHPLHCACAQEQHHHQDHVDQGEDHQAF